MLRILFFLLTAGTMLSLQSCGTKAEQPKKMDYDRIPVKIIPLNPYNAVTSVSVSGQFTTDDETLLSFKTTGIIQKIFVREGDAIKKGQLLAILNTTEIDASLEQAKLSFEKAYRDHQRLVNLYNDSVATLEQVQNAKTSMDQAAQQLNSAGFNRRYSEIRAGDNGFVLKRLASEGQQISSGNPVFQTNGAGSVRWILRAGVTDKQWTAIQTGDQATVDISNSGNGNVHGKVTRKSEAVDPSNGLFSVDITIVKNQPEKIAAGMFGTGIITTATGLKGKTIQTNTWLVPYEALLDGDGSTGYVFVTDDNQKSRRVKVNISGIEKDHVIVSRGLENAGSLIVSGSAYLTDGSPITIIQ